MSELIRHLRVTKVNCCLLAISTLITYSKSTLNWVRLCVCVLDIRKQKWSQQTRASEVKRMDGRSRILGRRQVFNLKRSGRLQIESRATVFARS